MVVKIVFGCEHGVCSELFVFLTAVNIKVFAGSACIPSLSSVGVCLVMFHWLPPFARLFLFPFRRCVVILFLATNN